jgi:hypothetical protein
MMENYRINNAEIYYEFQWTGSKNGKIRVVIIPFYSSGPLVVN